MTAARGSEQNTRIHAYRVREMAGRNGAEKREGERGGRDREMREKDGRDKEGGERRVVREMEKGNSRREKSEKVCGSEEK